MDVQNFRYTYPQPDHHRPTEAAPTITSLHIESWTNPRPQNQFTPLHPQTPEGVHAAAQGPGPRTLRKQDELLVKHALRRMTYMFMKTLVKTFKGRFSACSMLRCLILT